MTPDDDDKLPDDPLKQGDALDGDFVVVASEDLPEDDEDDDDDTEDGKSSGDQAALALNTPEPAQAEAEAAPVKGKGKPPRQGRKAKAGAKSGAGERFAKAADAGEPSGKTTALGITIDGKAFSLDETAAPVEDPAPQELSDFDRDEITDPEGEDFDPLQILLGERERPWENEKLTAAERNALNKVYRSNDPLAQQKKEEQERDPKAKGRDRDNPGRVAAAAAVGLGVAALAAKKAAAQTPVKAQADKGATLGGISRGPRREAEQAQTQQNNEAAKPSIVVQARENAEDVSQPRSNEKYALTMGVGILTGEAALSASALQNQTRPGMEDNNTSNDWLRQLDLQQMEPAWTPQPEGLQGAMAAIYDNLGQDDVMNVSPYRQAGWDEIRTQQQHNAMDITVAPTEPEPAPAPEPEYRPQPQIIMGM